VQQEVERGPFMNPGVAHQLGNHPSLTPLFLLWMKGLVVKVVNNNGGIFRTKTTSHNFFRILIATHRIKMGISG